MKHIELILKIACAMMMAVTCSPRQSMIADTGESSLYRLIRHGEGYDIITYTTDGQRLDSLWTDGGIKRIVCMSSTYVACIAAIGQQEKICSVSGIQYISDSLTHDLFVKGRIMEAGSDVSPDYERIISAEPDLVVTYSLSGNSSVFAEKIKSFGIPVLILNDHLENNPLGRASYVRIFGALTGKLDTADSIFSAICRSYIDLSGMVNKSLASGTSSGVGIRKVLMNIPYTDAWYIPGGENYMSRLVKDAGGEVLGAVPDRSESSIISVEQAFALSKRADVWLNTGWCDTKKALAETNAMFSHFDIPLIFNNTARVNKNGGNDFWESGAVRPDLILNDLVRILHPEFFTFRKGCLPESDSLHFYREVL